MLAWRLIENKTKSASQIRNLHQSVSGVISAPHRAHNAAADRQASDLLNQDLVSRSHGRLLRKSPRIQTERGPKG